MAKDIISALDTNHRVNYMTLIDRAWLAAAIDGEGSIGLYDYGKEGRRVCIQMGNTNKDFVKKMREIIGCGSTVYRHEFHGSHHGKKPMYHYTLKGSVRCYAVLRQIRDYLIIKKDKADKIINELESKPFGRWANATPEARLAQSNRMKEIWRKRKSHSLRVATAKTAVT